MPYLRNKTFEKFKIENICFFFFKKITISNIKILLYFMNILKSKD